jgi:hypothetical protein
MPTPLFLDDAELVQLTGWRLKSRQIRWLRDEGVPFRVNATGHPVVTRLAVEGRNEAVEQLQQPVQAWTPRVIARGA